MELYQISSVMHPEYNDAYVKIKKNPSEDNDFLYLAKDGKCIEISIISSQERVYFGNWKNDDWFGTPVRYIHHEYEYGRNIYNDWVPPIDIEKHKTTPEKT